MFAIFISIWVLLPHLPRLTDETDRLFTYIGIGLFVGGVMYLVYLAIEPFVRRSWPTMLVGWSRALAGRLRDAVIGRDLIVGRASGLALTAFDQLRSCLVSSAGREPMPITPRVGVLEHSRYFVLTITNRINNGLQNALLSVMMFTVLREVVRRGASRLGFRTASDRLRDGRGRAPPADRPSGWCRGIPIAPISGSPCSTRSSSSLIFLFVLLRYGLLATFVMFTANALTMRMPLTLNGANLYAGPAWLMLGLLFAWRPWDCGWRAAASRCSARAVGRGGAMT